PKAERSWSACGRRRVDSGVNAERAEPGPSPALQLVRSRRLELVERLPERPPEEPGRFPGIGVRTAAGLRDDAVDHTELEAVERVRLECGGRLLRPAGVEPEDRGTALGRDH